MERQFCQYGWIGEETSVDIHGLDCGYKYRFRVRGCNEAGWGEWSAPCSLSLAPYPPTPPLFLVLTSSTRNGVGCTWLPPQDLGGKSLIQYQVEIMSAFLTTTESELGMPQGKPPFQ